MSDDSTSPRPVTVLPFRDRKYKAYIILGDPVLEPIWVWPRWRQFAELLDPVLAASRDKPALRVDQYERTTNKILKFGRLVWSPESQAKWVHESTVTMENCKNWAFYFLEIYAPSRPVCGREAIPPDCFVSVINEAYLHKATPLQFNPLIYLCVAADLPESVLQKTEATVRGISRLVSARLTATLERPWTGNHIGPVSQIYNSIQDMMFSGFFRLVPTHQHPVALTSLKQQWQIFS